MGNSLGLIIPSAEAARQGLTEGDSVEIEIQNRASLRELFGSMRFSRTSQEIKDEARKGWGE
jgi:antitoxin component of MazEF toxin-antitoxin module